MYSWYSEVPNVARDIFSVTAYGSGVEAPFACVQGIISWREAKAKYKTIHEKAKVRRLAQASNAIVSGNDPAFG
jgi:hypothetical protein